MCLSTSRGDQGRYQPAGAGGGALLLARQGWSGRRREQPRRGTESGPLSLFTLAAASAFASSTGHRPGRGKSMPTIIDLSTPIEDHSRWAGLAMGLGRPWQGLCSGGDLERRHGWTGSTTWTAPAPLRARRSDSLDDAPREQTVGDATVFDLALVEPDEAIMPARSADAAKLLRPGRHRGDAPAAWSSSASSRTEGAPGTEALDLTVRGGGTAVRPASPRRRPSTSRRTTWIRPPAPGREPAARRERERMTSCSRNGVHPDRA